MRSTCSRFTASGACSGPSPPACSRPPRSTPSPALSTGIRARWRPRPSLSGRRSPMRWSRRTSSSRPSTSSSGYGCRRTKRRLGSTSRSTARWPTSAEQEGPSARERRPIDEDLLAPEAPGTRVPREQDRELQPDVATGGPEAGERADMRRLEHDRLEHSLRPDHDVREGERVVGERGEQLRVERPRAVMALPAEPRPDDLVYAL